MEYVRIEESEKLLNSNVQAELKIKKRQITQQLKENKSEISTEDSNRPQPSQGLFSKLHGLIKKVGQSIMEFGQNLMKPKNYCYAFVTLVAMLLSSYINDKLIDADGKDNSINDTAIESLKNSPVSTFFVGSVVVALVEESFYRKFIIDVFSKYTNKPIAYFVSCFLFIFEHFYFDFRMIINEIYRLPAYTCLALILAYAYDHSGTIVPTFIAHTINNILGFVELYMSIKN